MVYLTGIVASVLYLIIIFFFNSILFEWEILYLKKGWADKTENNIQNILLRDRSVSIVALKLYKRFLGAYLITLLNIIT